MSTMDSQLINDFPWIAEADENFMFSLLNEHDTNLPVNEENERMIKVEEDVNIFNNPNILSCASNNLSQQEIGDTRNGEGEQEQLQQRFINNSVSTMAMDTEWVWEGQQIVSQTARTTDEEQYCHDETINFVNHDDPTQGQRVLQSSTTDEYPLFPYSQTQTNNDAIEEKMNGLEYCCHLLAKLQLGVKTWTRALRNTTISAKTTEYYLTGFLIPSPAIFGTNSEDPLNALLQLFQGGINLLSSFRWRCTIDDTNPIDLTSKESHEPLEKTISTTSEHDGNHLNRNIRAVKRPILSPSTIPKEIDAVASSLSQLLSEARAIHESSLIDLSIAQEPQEQWKRRSISYFNEKSTTCIQDRSGIEKHHPRIEWRTTSQYDGQNLFLLVQALGYNDCPHRTNFIVSARTKLTQPAALKKRRRTGNARLTLKDLDINDEKFDEKTKTILLPVASTEYRQGRKYLEVIMFRSYKTSDQIVNTNEVDNAASENEEINENRIDSSIEDEICKLSKLRICLCRLTCNGALEYISRFVNTGLIEECKGSVRMSLTIINSEELRAKRLRNDGKETIYLTLSKDSEKKGFIIHLNGNKLPPDQFHGVKNQQISFNSLPQTVAGQNHLKLQVWKESILETIKKNLNPYHGLHPVLLLNVQIYYESLNNNQPPAEYSNMAASNQSNGIGPTHSLIL